MRLRQLKEIIRSKRHEITAFWRHSQTPMALTLDTLRLKSSPFVGVSSDGIKLELRPRAGESFTFFENLIRRDYFGHGICLGAGETVVDIGANIGAFAVLAAKIVGPTGRVIAFEPVSTTFARLQANVALNGLHNVVACRQAIEARDGTVAIRVGAKSAFATAHGHLEGETTVETVPSVSIERIFDQHGIDRIQLLKMDCEGGEYGILRSLSNELASRIDQVAMEVHDVEGESIEEIATILVSLGFSIDKQFDRNWVAFNNRRSSRRPIEARA